MMNITCFGEILWDVFPNIEKIGGAPLNVAVRLQSLNNNVAIISRVGKDEKGRAIVQFLQQNQINTDSIQWDEELATGDVDIILNSMKSATYDIKYPRAWDNIHLTKTAISLTKTSDAFVFGSLVTRHQISRSTLYELLKLAKFKVFDLNLRPPYYNFNTLMYLMNAANFIKFNDDELLEVSLHIDTTAAAKSLEENILLIADLTHTDYICVTRGKKGAILYYNKAFYYNDGYTINVVDTVGAGDSFLASLVDGLLKNNPPQQTVDFASAVGALVASKEGANPEITKAHIHSFVEQQVSL